MRTPIRLACSASLALSLFACDKGGEGQDKASTDDKAAQASNHASGHATADASGSDAKPSDGGGGEQADAGKGGAEVAKDGGKKAELAKNTFKVPTKAEAEKAKADYQSHLDAGRKAVKAKDYKTGISELKQAKDLAPMNGKVLGELGWAYFLDGQNDHAQNELVLALQHADNDKTRGAVLYNLGRVEEKRGNNEIAADHYRASLERRPNDIVQARLDGLGGGRETTHAQCNFTKERSPSPYDLCARYIRDMEASVDGDAVECVFDATRDRDLPDDYAVSAGEEPEFTESVFMLKDSDYLATVFSYVDYDMQMEYFVLAVVVGDDWWTTPLAEASHPGVGYADENVDSVELEAKEVTGSGKKEIIARWKMIGHDMDPGVEYMEDYSHSNIGVVSLDSGTPKWMATVRTRAESASGEMDTEKWGEYVDAKEYEAAATHSFADGSITVAKQGGEAPKSSPTGTFELGQYPVLCPSEQDYFGL